MVFFLTWFVFWGRDYCDSQVWCVVSWEGHIYIPYQRKKKLTFCKITPFT